MSTTAKEDGCVVITEVGPHCNQGEPSKTGAGANRAPMKPLQSFYKGEPIALGKYSKSNINIIETVQPSDSFLKIHPALQTNKQNKKQVTLILCGIIQIFLGIAHDIGDITFHAYGMPLILTGAPEWSGILCIISGSVSVAAAKNPRIGLVRGSLAMNIISAVASGVSMLIYISYILTRQIFYSWVPSCEHHDEREGCEKAVQIYVVSWGITFVLLAFSILQLCVSISVSAFGCKTLCRTAYSEVSVVIYKTAPSNSADPGVNTALPSCGEFEKP